MVKRISLILCYILIALVAQSQDFKTTSVLSSGKWIKMRVVESGVYEVSYDDLRSYGFSQPEKVRVYGRGGNAMSERLSKGRMDDLVQTPVLHRNSKIYFYTKGVSNDSLKIDVNDGSHIVSPIPNPYSKYGAIFLTDSEQEVQVAIEDYAVGICNGIALSDKGFGMWVHEEEKYNPGMTGQNFLGANILGVNQVTHQVPMPAFANEGKVYLSCNFAVMSDTEMSSEAYFDGAQMFSSTLNRISKNSTISYLEYGNLLARNYIELSSVIQETDSHTLNVRLQCFSTFQRAWEDYCALTYPTYLVLPEDMSQIRHFISPKSGEGFLFSNYDIENTLVWLVDMYGFEQDKVFQTKNIPMTWLDSGYAVNMDTDKSWAELIMFNPTKQQLKPEYVGEVANQNLHSAATPDMLIITNSYLFEQAERLAQFHREHDGMDVLVVNQEEVFNEFSGGVRDAMAYRLMCKMFYDRDKYKFKYLLLFGQGTFDNRMLYVPETAEYLITYQSELSYSQKFSYSTDDFFGFLTDSELNYSFQKMNISVGRLPVSKVSDARVYVDKVISYYKDVEEGDISWKNNIMLIAEDGDTGYHEEQCEMFLSRLNGGRYEVNPTKVYNQGYADEEFARKFRESLNLGQYFYLYIGHGTFHSLTHDQLISNLGIEEQTHFKHQPIAYFSSCDVARYDNNERNLIRQMLVNEKGGLVCGIGATRVALIVSNSLMTNAFAENMARSADYFSGEKTIGRILLAAKNACNDNSENHLKYHLLGDPAIKISLPENKISLTSISHCELEESSKIYVSRGAKTTVEGEVRNEEGNVDTSFNGDLKLQIFDADKYFITSSVDGVDANNYPIRIPVDLYSRGALLHEVGASVTNGKFTCTIAVPEFCSAERGEVLPIRMIAYNDQGKSLSGICNNMVSDNPYQEIIDTTKPAITDFYVNDKATFVDGMEVNSDITVYAELYDENGINICAESPQTALSVVIDGGKRSCSAVEYTPHGDTGGTISMPVYDLSEGMHTIELIATDLFANQASKMLSVYVVKTADNAELTVDRQGVKDSVVFDLENGDFDSEALLVVKDSQGNIYYKANVTQFPYEWDLRDSKGERLPAGDYDVYAIINGKGTKIKKIVVLKQ